MAEYVERKTVIEVIQDNVYQENLVDEIKDIPAADVQPVKHGRWIGRDCHFDFECKCSVCGYKDFFPTEHDRYWFNRNYCPNCGAKMDGEEDG